MINRILSFLSGDPSPHHPLPETDSRHLLGALMVRMAQIDDAIKLEEVQAIDRLFVKRFNLGPIEAAKMRADCTRLAETLPETEFLGPLLAAKIPPEQRFALREALQDVAYADGKLHPREEAMIQSVHNLLQDAI